MWLGNTYSTTAQNNDFIKIGGWGDRYYGFWKFDWRSVRNDLELDKVNLYFYPDKLRNAMTNPVSSTTLFLLTTSWNETTTKISDPLRGYDLGSFPLSTDYGLSLNITSLYNYWVKEGKPNYGVLLYPDQNNANYFFFPNRESGSSNRVRAVAFYKPIPNLKMPLPGGKEWKLTTEIGDASLESHSGANYYSIDFAPTSRLDGSGERYETNVRVYAAASGVVCEIGYKPRVDAKQTNGYYVVIDHDGDGDVNTGLQTRYLHLAYDSTLPGPVYPGLRNGSAVKQGQFIGTLGKTGTNSEHLHLGFRYKNSGSNIDLAGRVLDGLRIDGYLLRNLTEGSFYKSTNTR
jgi:murein DD-endopeptidase MepM/ murein hydrolase activator NlpD